MRNKNAPPPADVIPDTLAQAFTVPTDVLGRYMAVKVLFGGRDAVIAVETGVAGLGGPKPGDTIN
jgi:hypothetical protein